MISMMLSRCLHSVHGNTYDVLLLLLLLLLLLHYTDKHGGKTVLVTAVCVHFVCSEIMIGSTPPCTFNTHLLTLHEWSSTKTMPIHLRSTHITTTLTITMQLSSSIDRVLLAAAPAHPSKHHITLDAKYRPDTFTIVNYRIGSVCLQYLTSTDNDNDDDDDNRRGSDRRKRWTTGEGSKKQTNERKNSFATSVSTAHGTKTSRSRGYTVGVQCDFFSLFS